MGTRTLISTDPDGTQNYEMRDGANKVVGFGRVPAQAPVEDQLTDRLRQGYDGLRTYINTASPTAAQTTAVVKLLCRIAIALVRRQLNDLDGLD